VHAAVLDSFALLAYLRREPGHKTVHAALKKAKDGHLALAMTEVNYAEVKYIVLRKDGPAKWRVVEALLSVLPIAFHPVDRALADRAAEYKARFKLSLADACAAALAKQLEAALYTGDPEFGALKGEVRLHMLEP
jgi:ribonuclease VapC